MDAVLFLILFLVVWSTVFCHHVEDPELENRKFAKAGKISISGLFPIHVRGCGRDNFKPNYLALSQAMVYAIERINSDSTILTNISLGFEIYDYCLVDRLAMETALEIINRRKLALMYANKEVCFSQNHGLGQIPVMIGSGNSDSSILVANLLQAEGIPLISYAATSDELSKKRSYPTFLRTVPPDRFQSQAMADIVAYFNWTYIAAIAADDAYGRSGIDYFRKKISNKGTCLAMESYFLDGTNETHTKISRIIEELKTMNKVKVVVLYCTSKQATLLIEEAYRQNLPKKTWIGSEGWGNRRDILNPRTLSVVKGHVGLVYRNVVVEEFVQYLMNLTSAYKPVHWWENFWELQFKCAFKPTNVSNPAKMCSDNFRITREMYDTKMHVSMSAYVINAVYAIAHALDAMYKCKVPHGSLEDGKCPSVATGIDPRDLLAYLKTVNFTSPVSTVKFDSNGDPTGSYTIINLQKNNGLWNHQKIGSWEASHSPQLVINDEAIMWNGDSKGEIPHTVCQDVCRPGYRQTRQVECCWQCIECGVDDVSQTYGSSNCTKCPLDAIPDANHTQCLKVPLVHISYSHPFGLAFTTLSCVGLLITACVFLIFFRHKDTPIVKASNKELSYMLLFCIAMCYLAPFIYLSEPTRVGCVLEQIWFYLFYTTCITILGAKTNKIVLLFEERVPRSNLKSGLLRYRHVSFMLCVILLECIIIILWVLVDPPHPHINRSTRDEHVRTCKPSMHVVGEVCHYLLMIILILASLFCCYFAYKARKLPDNFNEGKFIVFSMYILIISWLTFYPVFLNIQDLYTVVVLSATTFVAASGLLVCMFWPKVYVIIWRPDQNTKSYMQDQITLHAFGNNNALERPTCTTRQRPRGHSVNQTNSSGALSHVVQSPCKSTHRSSINTEL